MYTINMYNNTMSRLVRQHQVSVQAVVKANSQSNGKGQISTPRGSKTPEQILTKPTIYN